VKRLLSRLAISVLAISFALLLLKNAIHLLYGALQIALRFVRLLTQAIAIFSQGEQTGVLRRLESCPRSCQESSYVSQ
jgi:hypothetical protein